MRILIYAQKADDPLVAKIGRNLSSHAIEIRPLPREARPIDLCNPMVIPGEAEEPDLVYFHDFNYRPVYGLARLLRNPTIIRHMEPSYGRNLWLGEIGPLLHTLVIPGEGVEYAYLHDRSVNTEVIEHASTLTEAEMRSHGPVAERDLDLVWIGDLSLYGNNPATAFLRELSQLLEPSKAKCYFGPGDSIAMNRRAKIALIWNPDISASTMEEEMIGPEVYEAQGCGAMVLMVRPPKSIVSPAVTMAIPKVESAVELAALITHHIEHNDARIETARKGWQMAMDFRAIDHAAAAISGTMEKALSGPQQLPAGVTPEGGRELACYCEARHLLAVARHNPATRMAYVKDLILDPITRAKQLLESLEKSEDELMRDRATVLSTMLRVIYGEMGIVVARQKWTELQSSPSAALMAATFLAIANAAQFNIYRKREILQDREFEFCGRLFTLVNGIGAIA